MYSASAASLQHCHCNQYILLIIIIIIITIKCREVYQNTKMLKASVSSRSQCNLKDCTKFSVSTRNPSSNRQVQSYFSPSSITPAWTAASASLVEAVDGRQVVVRRTPLRPLDLHGQVDVEKVRPCVEEVATRTAVVMHSGRRHHRSLTVVSSLAASLEFWFHRLWLVAAGHTGVAAPVVVARVPVAGRRAAGCVVRRRLPGSPMV